MDRFWSKVDRGEPDDCCRNRACVNPAQGYQPTVLAAVAALGVAADLEQYRLPDGTISHVYEHVRQVVRGDWVQACHGDEGNWEQVDQAPIHAETQTGLPTRNLAGEVRLRWWGNEDLVRMAERPVPDPAAWRAEAGR